MVRLPQAPRVKAVHFKVWHGSGKGRCVRLRLLHIVHISSFVVTMANAGEGKDLRVLMYKIIFYTRQLLRRLLITMNKYGPERMRRKWSSSTAACLPASEFAERHVSRRTSTRDSGETKHVKPSRSQHTTKHINYSYTITA